MLSDTLVMVARLKFHLPPSERKRSCPGTLATVSCTNSAPWTLPVIGSTTWVDAGELVALAREGLPRVIVRSGEAERTQYRPSCLLMTSRSPAYSG